MYFHVKISLNAERGGELLWDYNDTHISEYINL